MKRLLLLIALIVGNTLFSQENTNKVMTTEAEYRYLTTTYAKLDNAEMLEGYSLEDFYQNNNGTFYFDFKRFVKDGKTKAILMKVTKVKRKDDKVRYLCMPINNLSLFKNFYTEYESIGPSMSLALDKINLLLLMQVIDNSYNNIDN